MTLAEAESLRQAIHHNHPVFSESSQGPLAKLHILTETVSEDRLQDIQQMNRRQNNSNLASASTDPVSASSPPSAASPEQGEASVSRVLAQVCKMTEFRPQDASAGFGPSLAQSANFHLQSPCPLAQQQSAGAFWRFNPDNLNKLNNPN